MPLPFKIGFLILVGVAGLMLLRFLARRRIEAHEIGPVRDSRGLQKTRPYFQPAVVERKVRSLFPNVASNEVLRLLDTVKPSPSGTERLQLALLKLSDGDLNELRLVELCTSEDGLSKGQDFVLISAAETPEAQLMGYEYAKLLPEQQEPIFSRDLRQYLRWVKR